MTPVQQSQCEIVEALINTVLPRYIAVLEVDVAVLRLQIPFLLKEVEETAKDVFAIPPNILDYCFRNMLGTLEVRGEKVFPGL